MKLLALLAAVALIGYVSSADVTVTRSDSDIQENSFTYNLELSDGTSISQSGKVTNPNEPDPEKKIFAVQGSYKYTDPASGVVSSVTYTADENGFQPVVTRR
ncbi:unnamed protein product [Allacma fusca]|uniref:Uncharacterized protein n=1 Tax=Allacma fusca TaxID=39272 RepID=A0A8J2PLZ7_9HEXA|nr:unnamed protein product [Allacma fusca]